jgi:FMN phosphatase YigB (HAD superfamily)
MADAADLVFLIDVDNTLLNNDLFQIDLQNHLQRNAGADARDLYWGIQENLMETLGYRDYLGAFQQYRAERPQDEGTVLLASYVLDYHYEKLLFPGALDVIARLGELGQVVLLTDGDAVFQPLKLKRSGLADAVAGAVIIAVHKEKVLKEIEARYPARHYVLIDDKLRLLSAIKAQWGDRVTTIFPRQGQFAFDAHVLSTNPPADITVNQIGDVLAERVIALLPG